MKRPMPVTILTDVGSHMAFGYQKKADSLNGPSPAGPHTAFLPTSVHLPPPRLVTVDFARNRQEFWQFTGNNF